ncbi:hypothetical protein UY3_08407 [Chelonia mydas]|uniref:HAT C-terminal dimerisation domain-containing protein n=1 Tax=Chelonia mydas TaxID=8469 RepID=M7B903_CHEMY|nr:hypothetical protein UY3_08407 [Chelonia mydas]
MNSSCTIQAAVMTGQSDNYDVPASNESQTIRQWCLPKSERNKVWSMLSEVSKEQHFNAETTKPEPSKKKINLLLVASDSDDENEHASVRSALDHYRAEPVISVDACALEWWLKNEGTYETLAHLAHKYLATPVTTVPCEQCRSHFQTRSRQHYLLQM